MCMWDWKTIEKSCFWWKDNNVGGGGGVVCQTVKDHSVSDNDDADENTRLRPSVSDIIKAPTSGLLADWLITQDAVFIYYLTNFVCCFWPMYLQLFVAMFLPYIAGKAPPQNFPFLWWHPDLHQTRGFLNRHESVTHTASWAVWLFLQSWTTHARTHRQTTDHITSRHL